jgi:hypothetical protein
MLNRYMPQKKNLRGLPKPAKTRLQEILSKCYKTTHFKIIKVLLYLPYDQLANLSL